MGNSEQDSKIYINITGKFTVNGPIADYTRLLKSVCCIVAMDLDKSGNKKTQYLISSVLFEHIASESDIRPREKFHYGVISNLESLECDVWVKKFTEHPYVNTFFSNKKKDTFEYFVVHNTLIKITYDLVLTIGKYDENNRNELQSRIYFPLSFEFDKFLIDAINNLHQKSLNVSYDLKSFIAETIVLGKEKVHVAAPILSKLDAAFGMQLNVDKNKMKTELNNVE